MRYLLFGYDNYYPSGGWNDFIKGSDDLEELKTFKPEFKNDYYHIVYLEKGEVIATGRHAFNVRHSNHNVNIDWD